MSGKKNDSSQSYMAELAQLLPSINTTETVPEFVGKGMECQTVSDSDVIWQFPLHSITQRLITEQNSLYYHGQR